MVFHGISNTVFGIFRYCKLLYLAQIVFHAPNTNMDEIVLPYLGCNVTYHSWVVLGYLVKLLGGL